MELKEIRRLGKVASDNIEKQAQVDEVIGAVADESMARALETGDTKLAEDALEAADMIVAVNDHPLSKEAGIKDFMKLLKTNPKSNELNKAFSLYEKETGKSKNDMKNTDIDNYVKKIRV